MSILQGTIPDDWQGDYCCYAVEWPDSPQWLAILRGVLVLPSRGRFWDENTGSVISACDVIRQTYDNNLHLEGVIMACNDPGLAQIAIALNEIAASMRANGSSCCDGGGAGGAPANEPPFDPTEEVDPGTDPPPDGFDSWEEFYANKCSVAFAIISKLEGDLGTLAVIQWGSAGAEAITASLLILLVTPIPAAAVIALVFFLLTVSAVVISTTALSIVVDNEEALICALYSGTSSQSSRDLFLAEFDGLATAAIADPVERFAVETLIRYMIGAAATNQLYAAQTTLILAEQDCQFCHDTCTNCIRRLNKDFGLMDFYITPLDWTEIDDQGGQGLFSAHFYATGPDYYKMRFRTLVGHSHFATPDFSLTNDQSVVIYEGDDFEAFQAACEATCITTSTSVNWFIRSATEFTVEIKSEFCF